MQYQLFLQWDLSLLHHLTSTKQYSQSQVFFSPRYLLKRRLGSYVLLSCLLGWARASPTLARLHCTRVRMLAGLLVAISVSFKWAHVNISRRLNAVVYNLCTQSVKGYVVPECSISVKETRQWRRLKLTYTWQTSVCATADHATQGQTAHQR